MKKVISTYLIICLLYLFVPFRIEAITTNTHSTDLEFTSLQGWNIPDASQTNLEPAGDFSIGLFFRGESLPTATGNNLFSKDGCGVGACGSLQRQYGLVANDVDSSGDVELVLLFCSDPSCPGGNRSQAYGTTGLSTATDYCVVATADVSLAGDGIALYLDGVAESLTVTDNSGTSVGSGTNEVGIGWNGFDNAGNFDGLIDHVNFWSGLLSAAEAASFCDDPCNFTAGSATLQGQWLFDDDAGVDQTANNNDLTNVNSATFVTTPLFSCAAPTGNAQIYINGALYLKNGGLYVK